VDQNTIEFGILAFIAAFVLFRLYTTLGKRTGAERPSEPRPAPVQGDLPREQAGLAQQPLPAPSGPAGDGLMAIMRVDSSFDPEYFVVGARSAYEMIVSAFAKGDREALQGLLTPKVYNSYVDAIAAREAKGEAGPELVRLRTAEIADADLSGDTARVAVRFEAELAEGAHGVRDAREKWTFERDVRSPDPNWLLARVTAA
jgi:predicted lipid-binding transport protein (Tim44 family)